MTPIVESFVENAPSSTVKDPRWLQVEVCREFQRGKCTRSDAECRFAHPDETVQVESGGKVTACFDSMKDRCQRESCKYFHPPHHIKLQLEANGRLLKQHKQQLQALQALQASQHMIQTPATVPIVPVNTLSTGVSAFPVTFVSTPVLTTSTTVPPATTNSNWRTEKVLPFLEVCQDYIKGNCTLTECSAAHPDMDLLRDRNQKRITVCMDYVKGRCVRDSCRYFHPPTHLQGKLKTVKITQSLISTSSRKRLGEPKDDLVYINNTIGRHMPLDVDKHAQGLPSGCMIQGRSSLPRKQEEQAKQQALNYTLINTPLALPANFTTFVQPSGFQPTANAMQFAPAFFSTVPLSVSQFATTTATTPYVHPQVQQDYNYLVTDPGYFYGYQPMPAYYQNGYQYLIPCEQQLSSLNNNHKHIQLPICRDYKSGNCRRDSCRYVHLDNRNVEVVDGKVTICLDAAKGKCQRTECRYYHHTSASDNKNDGKS